MAAGCDTCDTCDTWGGSAPTVATVATVAVAESANESIPPTATREQEAELRALVASILANESDADRAEALAIAVADPEAALVSFRALVAGLLTNMREGGREADDRGACTACRNLTQGGRCLAAWRGERIGNAGRQYSPVPDIPRRCEGYEPTAADPDPRPGAERWPSLIVGSRVLH